MIDAPRFSAADRARIIEHLAPGRCPSCGHKVITWSPFEIVRAARTWTRDKGRVPTAPDWAEGMSEHPAQTTVLNMFGSWNRMLAAAGLAERGLRERRPIWTKQMVVEALLDYRMMHDRWPTWRDWAKPKPAGRKSLARPSSWTVRKLFGSWKAALVYASGETDPSLPGNGHLKPAAASPVEPSSAAPGGDEAAAEHTPVAA